MAATRTLLSIKRAIAVFLIASAPCIAAEETAAVEREHSTSHGASASEAFLRLISGAGHRDAVRLPGVPVLLLPVPAQHLAADSDHDGYNLISSRSRFADALGVISSRRRLVAEYDEGDSNRLQSRGSWDRTPVFDDERAVPDANDGGECPEDLPPVAAGRASYTAQVRPWPSVAQQFRGPSYSTPRNYSVPTIIPAELSQRLVEKFRAQVPSDEDASLPAILQAGCDVSERVLFPDVDDDDEQPPQPDARSQPPRAQPARARTSPARPRFARPLKLRAVLSVPRAGFSEAYTAWWDPNSGDARVHFQDGSAATFRDVLPNGLVHKVEMHVDRSEGRAVRRCSHAVVVAGAADRANPALPDLQLFSFAGYDEQGAERWQQRVEGTEGGARGEVLTTLHELVLFRDAEDSAIPIRYSVAVNSSVLGAGADGYHHHYLDVRYHTRPHHFFRPNIAEVCDVVEQVNAAEPESLARLEPLREFTLPRRDPRYDAALERFQRDNDRLYVDDAEAAVRKNLLVQSSRFVSSGNRAGATFQLGVNFLADRLDDELHGMYGVEGDEPAPARAKRQAAADGGGGDWFPYSRKKLAALEPSLPAQFDWRARGGVTPVRFQGTACASCWAFATVGAVEGALFLRTGRLTPLSEQQLLDCAHQFGARGCGGTWPSRAYDYIKARGLAALDDYADYTGKVEGCKEESVPPVTRISGHVNVTKYSVPALQVSIMEHGPNVVIVDSSPKSFTMYSKGVLYDDRCSKKKAKHAVVAVGWGSQKGEPFFILKNSWSEAWGERGYLRVQARANTCGVLTHPSYPRVERADVVRA